MTGSETGRPEEVYQLLLRLLRRFCPGCAEGVNSDRHLDADGQAYLAAELAPYIIGEIDRARAEGMNAGPHGDPYHDATRCPSCRPVDLQRAVTSSGDQSTQRSD